MECIVREMTRLASWLLPCALLGVSAGVSRTVLAEKTPLASGRSKGGVVAESVRRGLRARDAGKCAEAEEAFEAALEAADPERTTEAQRAEILGELGLCELEQRKHRDAAEHLTKSLEAYQSLRPAVLRRVRAGQKKALSRVGRVYVAVNPSDAAVLVDGRPLGGAARVHDLFLDPGPHTIRARLSGYGDGVATLDIAAGSEQGAALTLSRAPEPAVPVKALATRDVTSAPQPVRARAPGPWASWPGTLRAGGIGIATATLSTGAVLVIQSRVLTGDIRERIDGLNDDPAWTSYRCRQAPALSACAELRDLRARRDVASLVGTAMLAAGAVFGAVTAVSFFTDFSFLRIGQSRDRIAVLPAVTGQQAAITVIGAF
jgi:hypothetical protein